MNVAFFIAKRYFISKKKRNFINFISAMSVIGVAVGTLSLIIVLSVFNGLEDLIRSIYGSFDPNLKITAIKGKSFPVDKNLIRSIKNIEGVELITEVIEDNALLKYDDRQTIVKMKGVSDEFFREHNIKKYVMEGSASFNDRGFASAIIGRGVQYKLGVDMRNRAYHLQFWYPRNEKKIQMNPEKSFNSANLFPGGIFALEKQYDDNYVFVPLEFAVSLTEYGNKRTALEVSVANSESEGHIKNKLEKILGEKFKIQTVDEQHTSMLRAIKIEKLFVYIVFSFIMVVSSLNIFFTLTMLAIDKKKDMNTLYSMGASTSMIKNIFLLEGIIIGVIGAVSGLTLGFVICYLQQIFGFVSMGTETSLINTYPIKMELIDFIVTGLIILIVTFLISYQPAKKASQIEKRLV